LSNDGLDAVKDGMGDAFRGMLGDGKSLTGLGEFRAAAGLYKYAAEAKKEPGRVEAMVIDKMAEKLLQAAHLEFVRLAFDQVGFKARGAKAGQAGYIDLHDLEVNLPPIKPNIYFVVVIKGIAMKNDALKMSFEIDSKVSFEELQLYSDGDRRLMGKSLVATLSLYLLAKMRIGQRKTKIGESSFHLGGFGLAEADLRRELPPST
jgi:hypothetical protein